MGQEGAQEPWQSQTQRREMDETNRTSAGLPVTTESREESLNRAFERVSGAPRREGTG